MDLLSIELSREGAFSIPNGNRRRDFGTVFLSLFTFEIDIWGRLRRATESAQAQLLASDWNRKTVITTLISDVATAYFNLLELDMELAIARNTLGTRQESLRLIRTQLQGGVGTLLDVRQGEQLVYGAAQSVPSSEQQIEQTENQISLLLGKNPGPVTRGRPLTEQQAPPEVPAGLPSALLEKTSGHSGSGANPGRDQRQHRGRQGSLFSANYAHRRVRLPEHRAREFILGFEKDMELCASAHAADLHSGSAPLSGGIGRSATAKRSGTIRKGNSSGFPRCLGCADSVSKNPGNPRLAGIAGDVASGSKASSLYEISRRR